MKAGTNEMGTNEMGTNEMGTNEESILKGLDRIPEEILLNNIYPNLSPKCLMWLSKEFYLRYHENVYSMIGNKRTITFPSGKFDAYIRYIIREEATFLLEKRLSERIKKWYYSSSYRYANNKYKNYLFFMYQYSIDNNYSKSRKCINDMAKSVLGKKWHK